MTRFNRLPKFKTVALLLICLSITQPSLAKETSKEIKVTQSIDLIARFNMHQQQNKTHILYFWLPETKQKYLSDGWDFASENESDVYPWPYLSETKNDFVIEFDTIIDRTIAIKLMNIGSPVEIPALKFTINDNELVRVVVQDAQYQFEYLIPSNLQNMGENILSLQLETTSENSKSTKEKIGLHSIKLTEGFYTKTALELNQLVRPSLALASPCAFSFPIEVKSDFFVEFDLGHVMLSTTYDSKKSPYYLKLAVIDGKDQIIEESELLFTENKNQKSSWELKKWKFSRPLSHHSHLQIGFDNKDSSAPTAYVGISNLRIYPAIRTQQPSHDKENPNLVLFTVSGLNFDSISCSGNDRVNTPFFDYLGKNSTSFTDVTACSNNDVASLISLFTGKYPADHLFYNKTPPLDFNLPVLTSSLKEKGYACYGILISPSNEIKSVMRILEGFDEFALSDSKPATYLEYLGKFLSKKKSGLKPVFLWVHLTSDTIAHLETPPLYRLNNYAVNPISLESQNFPFTDQIKLKNYLGEKENDLRVLQSRYDTKIYFLCKIMDNILRSHRSLKSNSDLLFSLVSTNGITRHYSNNPFSTDSLSQEVIHVPLFSGSYMKDNQPVSNLNFKPVSARIVREFLSGSMIERKSGLVSEKKEETIHDIIISEHNERRIIAYRNDSWKMIYCFTDPYYRISFTNLFNLAADPSEKYNLVGKYPLLSDDFAARILKFSSAHTIYPAPQKDLTEEANELIKSLNYMQ